MPGEDRLPLLEAAAPDLPSPLGTQAPTLLAHAVAFDPNDPAASLSTLPESCGLFALFAEDPKSEPYLAKASHLRRRLQRFLRPAPSQTRRLQLAGRIRRIEYTETGSDFASDLAYYEAATAVESIYVPMGISAERTTARSAEKRLRLRPAAFLKLGYGQSVSTRSDQHEGRTGNGGEGATSRTVSV